MCNAGVAWWCKFCGGGLMKARTIAALVVGLVVCLAVLAVAPRPPRLAKAPAGATGSPNRVTPAELATAPRVYLGSAWEPAMRDLMTKPEQWPTARASAGYFLQPMGFKSLKNEVGGLLEKFQTRWMMGVETLGNAKKGQHVLQNLSKAAAAAPDIKCAGLALYVATKWLRDGYDDAVATFKKWAGPVRALGIPVYFFFTPVTGQKDAAALHAMLTSPKNGDPLWIAFCKAAGADGVAIDYPSGFWVAPDSAVWNTLGYRDVALSIYKTTKAAGLRFAWALNGTTAALKDIRTFASDLAKRGVVPDAWWVDHFSPMAKTAPGTPETTTTPSGIAAELIKGQF